MTLRADGRQDGDLRAMVCERGVLARADGSARWFHGKTSVLAAVYGPRAVGSRREDPDRATVDVLWRPLVGPASGAPAVDSLRMAAQSVLESAVAGEAYPRTGVTVILQEMHDDGSLLACALHAAGAALADAGVPLRGILAAAAVIAPTAGPVMMDPTKAEEAAAGGCVTAAFHCRGGDSAADRSVVALCHTRGRVTAEGLDRARVVAAAAATKVACVWRAALSPGAIVDDRTPVGVDDAMDDS